MAKRKLKCPKCEHEWECNYWKWVWKAPFHWLVLQKKPLRIRDYRKTKCPNCGKKSWIASSN